MSVLLILTVGTGTKGAHSNLAQGLVNTLHQIRPRKFWLVPSMSPDSTAVAEMVRDGAPGDSQFQPWSAMAPFRGIDHHDDLFSCRTAIREVICAARRDLGSTEQLMVNPTSGTKQMSVAAVLAALDEEIGEIVFTVGDRADGVVKTGTERMAQFSTRQFLLERDLRQATELFAAGAFFAAARLLKSYPDSEAARAREIALCLQEWQRMNYAKAAGHAARFSEQIRTHLKRLSEAGAFSVEVLADLLAGAGELLRWGDCEEALARYYRGAEQTAKVRLAVEHDIIPPYRRDALLKLLPAGSTLAKEIQERSTGGEVLLGNDRAWRVLQEVRDPLADAYFADSLLQRGLRQRHESMFGHGTQPVEPSLVRSVRDRIQELLRHHFPAAADASAKVIRPIGF